MNLVIIALLLYHHFAEQGISVFAVWRLWQNPITDHTVDGIAKEREIGLGSQRFFDHHLLWVDHQAIGADIWIGEDPSQQHHLLIYLLQRLEDVHSRQERAQERLGGVHGHISPALGLVSVPEKGLRHAQES